MKEYIKNFKINKYEIIGQSNASMKSIHNDVKYFLFYTTIGLECKFYSYFEGFETIEEVVTKIEYVKKMTSYLSHTILRSCELKIDIQHKEN